jgi:ABC-type oligopeptide transport system substrate-binding subunit
MSDSGGRQSMAHDVFVSYSSKDKAIADTIVAAMENNQIRCWYAPRDIQPSEDWAKAITSAIEQCKVFLMIFSGNANESQHVLDELAFAIDQQTIILPFRVENLEPKGAMRLHLSSRHWLNAYDPSWESHIRTLIKNVSVIMETNIDEQQIVVPERVDKKTKHKKKLTLILAGIASIAILLTAGWFGYSRITKQEEIPDVTPDFPEQVEEVEASASLERNGILNLAYEIEGLELDPQKNINIGAVIFPENLFLNLTNFDFEKGEVIPEAAESWSISPDGKLYTFKIRQDIPWVTHTLGGETVHEVDENGNKRFVNAHDFEYAIRRICDPNFQESLNYQFISLIKGCQDVFEYQDPDNIPDELFNAIGARAVSDSELLIELTEPSAYFLTMTIMNTISAVPQWTIEKFANAWKNPGMITTNGYYVIDDIKLGESIRLVRNSLFPEDMAGRGNIGGINIQIDQSIEERYQLWIEKKIDFSAIPNELVSEHQTAYPDKNQAINDQTVYFFLFNDQRIPFNNVHVRRAFAAAIDKSSFIDKTFKENGLSITHLGLPELVGAPPYDEVGLGFDVDYAKDELALGGYPNCTGFPRVTFYTSQLGVDEIIQDWERALGCEPGTINTSQEIIWGEWDNVDIISMGWIADFPDMHNLMGNLISCERDVFSFEPEEECNQIDEMIDQAKQEISLNKRTSLYAQIEDACFGSQGDFPIIPMVMQIQNFAVHNWLETDNISGAKIPYYNWIIDMDLKQNSLPADAED